MQPTELVQESYVRLLDWHAVQWQNRAHFFATTARMMRRVLVDAARARQAAKRGTGSRPVARSSGRRGAGPGVDVVAWNDALAELATIDPRPSQVVEMRFFGGFRWKKQPRHSACRSARSSTTGTRRGRGSITRSRQRDRDER